MIVAFTGLLEDSHGNRRIAGAGKDEAAKALVERGFVSVAFADIMKRWCKELFGFTDEQLWGPSEERAKPDKRYPRRHSVVIEEPDELGIHGAHFEESFLTPRYALQKLGDWGRDCYPDIWANKALEIANRLLHVPGSFYEPGAGCLIEVLRPGHELEWQWPKGVVIPDCRFQNEFRRVKEEGGTIIRVKRRVDEFPSQLDDSHISERDILAWGDDKFDHIVENSGDVKYLRMQTEQLFARLSGRIIPYDEEQKDIPPFKRK